MRKHLLMVLLVALPVAVAQGSLGTRTWELQRIGTKAVTAARKPTISFGKDRVNVFFGCNKGGGSYTLKGRALKFGPLVSTKMACGTALDALETEFARALTKVARYSVSADGSNTLDLSPSGSGVLLRFTPKP